MRTNERLRQAAAAIQSVPEGMAYRMGTVTAFSTTPPRTVTATIGGQSIANIPILDHVAINTGSAVWFAKVGQGKLLGVGSVNGTLLRMGSGNDYAQMDSASDEQVRLSRDGTGRPYIAFYNERLGGTVVRKSFVGWPNNTTDSGTGLWLNADYGDIVLKSPGLIRLFGPDASTPAKLEFRDSGGGSDLGTMIYLYSTNYTLGVESSTMALTTGQYFRFTNDDVGAAQDDFLFDLNARTIDARTDGAAATLGLNPSGGALKIGGSTDYAQFQPGSNEKLQLVEDNATGRPYISFWNQNEAGTLVRKGYIGYPTDRTSGDGDSSDIYVQADQSGGAVVVESVAFIGGAMTGVSTIDASSDVNIAGDLTMDGTGSVVVLDAGGTLAAPALAFEGDLDNGFYRLAADQNRISAGNAAAVTCKKGTTYAQVFMEGVTLDTAGAGTNLVIQGDGRIRKDSSSQRNKNSIETMQDQYADELFNLRPVWFRFNEEAGGRPDWSHYGLIAEEVAAYIPQAVKWGPVPDCSCDVYEYVQDPDDPDAPPMKVSREGVTRDDHTCLAPEALDYGALIGLLIQVVQRQQVQIDDLSARIA